VAKLTPIQIDANTVIYIEMTDDIPENIPVHVAEEPEEEAPVTYGPDIRKLTQQAMQKGLDALKSTIRAYTDVALDAFEGVSKANVNKVTLEFGVKVVGETALIPYITKNAAESNLKITVECSFPDKTA
jgi:hypothetical protein